MEIIGEASNKVSDELKANHPEIEWKMIAGMRDKLIHEYFGIDLEILWQVAKKDLKSIRPAIRIILKELKR